MSVVTRTIVGPVRGPDGVPLEDARYTFTLDRRDYVASTGEVVEPAPVVRTVTADGNFDTPLALWPNDLGVMQSAYVVRVALPSGRPTEQVLAKLLQGDGTALALGSWLALGEPIPGDTTSLEALIDAAVAGLGPVADGSITTAKLADLAVTTAKVADGAIATAKVPDAAITAAKVAGMTAVPATTWALGNGPRNPQQWWDALTGKFEQLGGAPWHSTAHRVPRVIARNAVRTEIVNTIAETEVWGFDVPANLLGATGLVLVHLGGDLLPGGAMFKLRWKFGAHTATGQDFTPGTSTNRRKWGLTLVIANSAAGAQSWHLQGIFSNSTADDVPIGSGTPFGGAPVSAVDTTATVRFSMTVAMSVASAANAIARTAGVGLIVPS